MVFQFLIFSFLIGTGILIIMLIFSLKAKNKVLKELKSKPTNKVLGPLISIIIPAFNEEGYLPNCLKSIKNQTYQNIEIIVADNNSEDKTEKIAKKFGAKLVKVKEKNVAIVRNEGAKMARGKILFFIDADCILENSCVEKLVRNLSEKVVFAHAGVCCYDSNYHNFLWALSRWFRPHFYTSGRNGACLWKRVFWEIKGYAKNLNPLEGYREDLDLGRRILKKFGVFAIKYCPNVLIGTSARREKIFGYPIWKIPSAWQKGIRGVRERKIIY